MLHRLQTACNRIQAILKFGCLRRTKDTLIDGKPLLQLPEKTVTVLEEDFDEDERGLYTASMCFLWLYCCGNTDLDS